MVVDMTGEEVVAATRKKCTADNYRPETIPCMIEGKVKILFVDTSGAHDYTRSIHVIASHISVGIIMVTKLFPVGILA